MTIFYCFVAASITVFLFWLLLYRVTKAIEKNWEDCEKECAEYNYLTVEQAVKEWNSTEDSVVRNIIFQCLTATQKEMFKDQILKKGG